MTDAAHPDDAEVEAPPSTSAPPDDGDAEVVAAAEAVEADLAAIVAQRDEYLAVAQRLQAEFENFKKQTMRRNTELIEHAATALVERLLPVLDAFDGALAHDEAKELVRPIYDALMDVLEKDGLEVVFPAGEPFDPTRHEAVMHEPADEGVEPTVTGVLRTGYAWKGRVLRPAMVKVKG